jgi:hypothetical protein
MRFYGSLRFRFIRAENLAWGWILDISAKPHSARISLISPMATSYADRVFVAKSSDLVEMRPAGGHLL